MAALTFQREKRKHCLWLWADALGGFFDAEEVGPFEEDCPSAVDCLLGIPSLRTFRIECILERPIEEGLPVHGRLFNSDKTYRKIEFNGIVTECVCFEKKVRRRDVAPWWEEKDGWITEDRYRVRIRIMTPHASPSAVENDRTGL